MRKIVVAEIMKAEASAERQELALTIRNEIGTLTEVIVPGRNHSALTAALLGSTGQVGVGSDDPISDVARVELTGVGIFSTSDDRHGLILHFGTLALPILMSREAVSVLGEKLGHLEQQMDGTEPTPRPRLQ